MKKILLSLSCLLISISTIFPAAAQEGGSKEAQKEASSGAKLTVNQWNHALAVCAQLVATDQGFAQSEENIVKKFNAAYSLDDLKNQYGSRDKWTPYYNAFKSHEGNPGTMDDLKNLINKEYPKFPFGSRVEKAMNDYIAKNPGDPAPNASPEPPAAQQANNGGKADAAQNDKAKAGADDEGEQTEEEEGGNSSSGASGWQILLNILLIAGVLGAILIALKARREADENKQNMMFEIDELKRQLENSKNGSNRGDNQQRKNKNRQQEPKPEQQKPQQKEQRNAHVVAPVSQTRIAAQLRDEKNRSENRQAKREQPKQEQPKREQPKQEQPKQEQPKQEQPKQEQPKQEQPKQEQPKQEQPKQEQPKQEQPKQEQPKQEQSVLLFGGQDDAKKEELKPEPKKEEPKKEEPKKEEPVVRFDSPRIIYLGRPDRNSDFTNENEKMQLGDTIYELVTMDGRSGSFSVISNRDVHYLALQLPGENILRACESDTDLKNTAAKTKIITDRSGRAKFIDGKWHIVTKAKVHYE